MEVELRVNYERMEGSVLDEMVEECDYKKNMEEYEQPICVFLLDRADALLCGNIQ